MFLQKLEPTVRRREPQASTENQEILQGIGSICGGNLSFSWVSKTCCIAMSYLLLFFFDSFRLNAHFCGSYQQVRWFCWEDMQR